MSREILTLQFGHYANYVGAHFWNTERCSFIYTNVPGNEPDSACEVAHDVLFREGRTRNTDRFTYTPRVVAVDRKGSLNRYPSTGVTEALAEANADRRNTGKRDQESTIGWNGPTELVGLANQQQLSGASKYSAQLQRLHAGDAADALDHLPLATSDEDADREVTEAFLDTAALNSRITSWSDYLSTAFNSKSLLITDSFWHNFAASSAPNSAQASEVVNSLSFTEARDAFGPRSSQFEELEDRVRFFTEECDYLAGFQMFADYASDALFGACAASVLENLLAEEYNHKAVVSFPVDLMNISANLITPTASASQSSTMRLDCMRIALNTAFALRAFDSYSSLVVPLTLNQPCEWPWSTTESRLSLDTAYLRSAPLSSFINSLTRPCRLKNGVRSLSDLAILARTPTDFSAPADFKFATASVAYPYQNEESGSLLAALNSLEWTSLSNGAFSAGEVDSAVRKSQILVASGLDSLPLYTPADLKKAEVHASALQLAHLKSSADLLERYVTEALDSRVRAVLTLKDRLKLAYPFPTCLFRNEYTSPLPLPRAGNPLPRCALAQIAQLETQYASSSLQLNLGPSRWHASSRDASKPQQASGVLMIDWLTTILSVLEDERNSAVRAQLFASASIEKDEVNDLRDYLSNMVQSYCCA